MGHDTLLQPILGLLMLAAPAVIGIFFGAPLVARELETGTFRIAWTQSVSRRRWLFVKLGVVGLAGVIASGLISLMVTWWFRPIDKINLDRFNPGVFDERGIVVLGYAAFAFALGVTAGVLFRRTMPAIAVTLAGFIGVRLAITNWVRPYLIGPVHQVLKLSPQTVNGVVASNGGATILRVAPIPNAWLYSPAQIVDKTGQVLTSEHLQSVCPQFFAPEPSTVNSTGGANAVGAPQHSASMAAAFHTCLAKLAPTYHVVITYQPANRYWTFQSLEMLIFVGLALALAGFCYWWVRYRIA